jgi:hypothetical protein
MRRRGEERCVGRSCAQTARNGQHIDHLAQTLIRSKGSERKLGYLGDLRR